MKNPVFGRVADARAEAHAEARGAYPWVRSRGTYLCTSDASGQCDPAPEAECPDWDGTLRDIRELVAKVSLFYPQVEKVYISGGFDGAFTFKELYETSDYEPWASAWDVTVWTRKDGYV